MTFILLVLLLILFLSQSKLKGRVSELESKIKTLALPEEVLPKNKSVAEKSAISFSNEGNDPSYLDKDLPSVINITAESPKQQTLQTASVSHRHQEIGDMPPEAATEFFLVSWFKDNTLIKIGSIIFFLGAVWLVSYAFISDWISPLALLFMGLALAIISYVVGYLRQGVSAAQYVILTALGTGIICATIFTAQIISTLFNPFLSLTLLTVSLLYTMYVAWQTNAKKLALVIALAGLTVPLLVDVIAEPVWLLLYLLILSIGLLFVGAKMELRSVSLLLLIGIILYELALFKLTEPNLLWFFVVIFSILFLVSVTFSFIKTKEANTFDVLSLALVSLAFVLFAPELSLNAGLATFIASLTMALVGYVLANRDFPIIITAVYVAFTSVFLLIATSFIFDGYTEVLAFALEITTVFMIATYLGLPEKVVRLIAFGYLLPLFASVSSFGSSAWDKGVWHADALVLLAVSAIFVISALWLIQKRTVAIYTWSKPLATIFTGISFFYTMGVVAQFSSALFMEEVAIVMTYVTWALMSVVGVYYTMKLKATNSVIMLMAATLIFPFLASFTSFASPLFANGIFHIHGFGVGVVTILLVLTTLLFTQLFYIDYNPKVRSFLGVIIIATITYIFLGISSIFEIMLGGELANVATYTTYLFILYGLITIFVLFGTNAKWLGIALLTLTLPLLLSFNSFSFNGWQSGDEAQIFGLFASITILVLIALGIRRRYHSEDAKTQAKVLSWSKALLIVASLYAIGYLWCLSHSILTGEKAVTLALFIYTLVGLFLYQYGHKVGKIELRRAGQLLLAFVVLRLLLVDVWEMELLWRIVTFLGIGLLFIGTALFEKPRRVEENKIEGLGITGNEDKVEK